MDQRWFYGSVLTAKRLGWIENKPLTPGQHFETEELVLYS
jgi:hypothetical protein